jgi:hypothetical protein
LDTPRELLMELRTASRRVDESLELLGMAAYEHAKAETMFKLKWASAYIEASGTENARKAEADIETGEERKALAKATAQLTFRKAENNSRLQQLSALQTSGKAIIADLELAR